MLYHLSLSLAYLAGIHSYWKLLLIKQTELIVSGVFFFSLSLSLFRWLIEINASPSLTASGKEDYDLKTGLLHDVLNVLDLENR